MQFDRHGCSIAAYSTNSIGSTFNDYDCLISQPEPLVRMSIISLRRDSSYICAEAATGEALMSTLEDRLRLVRLRRLGRCLLSCERAARSSTGECHETGANINGSVRPIPRHVTPGTLVKWSSCCGELVLKTVMPQISSVQRMLIFRLQSFSASGHRADDKVSELG